MMILMSSRSRAEEYPDAQWIDIVSGQYEEGVYPPFPKEEGNRIMICVSDCAGALCEALYAVDYIDNEGLLVIGDLPAGKDVRRDMEESKAVCLLYGAPDTDRDGEDVVQLNSDLGCTAVFRRGSDFVEAAKAVILKGKKAGELFTIADAVNELILGGGAVAVG